jgi:hypothetical protein
MLRPSGNPIVSRVDQDSRRYKCNLHAKDANHGWILPGNVKNYKTIIGCLAKSAAVTIALKYCRWLPMKVSGEKWGKVTEHFSKPAAKG